MVMTMYEEMEERIAMTFQFPIGGVGLLKIEELVTLLSHHKQSPPKPTWTRDAFKSQFGHIVNRIFKACVDGHIYSPKDNAIYQGTTWSSKVVQYKSQKDCLIRNLLNNPLNLEHYHRIVEENFASALKVVVANNVSLSDKWSMFFKTTSIAARHSCRNW